MQDAEMAFVLMAEYILWITPYSTFFYLEAIFFHLELSVSLSSHIKITEHLCNKTSAESLN